MSWAISLILVLCSFSAWGFEYQIDEASLLNPSTFQISQIGQNFSRNGFESLSDLNLAKAGFAFDRVYNSFNWESSLLLKAGLRVPTNVRGRILEDQKLGIQVFHFEYQGTPYMLMAVNVSKEVLQKLVRPWLVSETATKWSWLLPRAHAASVCTTDSPQGNSEDLKSTAEAIETNEIIRGIGRCGMDVLSGAASSVEGTFNFFKKLVTDPQQLWTETKQSYQELKHFVMNIESELRGAFAGFQNMTTTEKVQMACTITGELLGVALQSLTGGAALAKAMPLLTLKLKAAGSVLSRMAALETLGVKFPNRAWMAREAMSCVR